MSGGTQSCFFLFLKWYFFFLVETNEEDIDEYSNDYKRQRQIRKLEKTVKKLHRAIQKLEEQELDFEDDEDSVYLLTER